MQISFIIFDVSAMDNASNLNNDDEIGEDSDKDDESKNVVDEGSIKCRRLLEELTLDPVKLYEKLKTEYYKLETFNGKLFGCLMFDLAHSLRKNTNELLWLACVSLTDQFVHDR